MIEVGAFLGQRSGEEAAEVGQQVRGCADFGEATFTIAAGFGAATFTGSAEFNGATFASSATLVGAGLPRGGPVRADGVGGATPDRKLNPRT